MCKLDVLSDEYQFNKIFLIEELIFLEIPFNISIYVFKRYQQEFFDVLFKINFQR